MTQVIDVAVWTQAADDFGAWWGVNGLAQRADGDLAIVANADLGLLAPDEWPPRASGNRA